MVYCIYSQHVVGFHALISLFTCDVPIRGTIFMPICAESAVKPQSFNQSSPALAKTTAGTLEGWPGWVGSNENRGGRPAKVGHQSQC